VKNLSKTWNCKVVNDVEQLSTTLKSTTDITRSLMEETRSKDEIKNDLKIAWEAWEVRPSNAAAALDMEEMCQESAALLGTTGTAFREKITEMRRARLPIDKILDNVFSIQVVE
jgi:hypothetical protein